jgi:hypothetical protein
VGRDYAQHHNQPDHAALVSRMHGGKASDDASVEQQPKKHSDDEDLERMVSRASQPPQTRQQYQQSAPHGGIVHSGCYDGR